MLCCSKDKSGSTGSTFAGVMSYLRAKRPVFVILENVPTILSQFSTIKAMVEPLGYVVHVINSCPTDLGLPERRSRTYIVAALSTVISQSDLEAASGIYSLMKSEILTSLDEFKLADTHPLVVAELERRTERA